MMYRSQNRVEVPSATFYGPNQSSALAFSCTKGQRSLTTRVKTPEFCGVVLPNLHNFTTLTVHISVGLAHHRHSHTGTKNHAYFNGNITKRWLCLTWHSHRNMPKIKKRENFLIWNHNSHQSGTSSSSPMETLPLDFCESDNVELDLGHNSHTDGTDLYVA